MNQRIPNKVIVLPNKEKSHFSEKWNDHRNLSDFPHPFRMLFIAVPNSGKTNLLKNILLHAKKPFERIMLWHCDASNTHEWDDIDAELYDTIPEIDEFDNNIKQILIIEDVYIKDLSRDDKKLLDRIFGYVSTHKNLSVALTAQDIIQVPPNIRRCCNVFHISRSPSLDTIGLIGRRCGITTQEVKYLFHYFINDAHDFITIDLTENSPAKIRKNLFEIIDEI